ncbi:phosphoribosylanthranilate isomerase [candidate division KSB1 bacterium]|nr:phosphoribosylanthranilate isomerase [candidate division KSB1 bacterium]
MRRQEDINVAVACGAAAVGFIFANSPRQVRPEQVEKLAEGVPVLKVGVFVNEDLQRVREIRHRCHLDIVQLHGDESPDYCERLGGRLFKAIRLKEVAMTRLFDDYPPDIKILLDAYVYSRPGGTGRQIDFYLLDHIHDFTRIIIAGGIGPDNAVEIFKRYHPFGIDVNSRVEDAPGIKNHEKILELFQKLKIIRKE